MNFHEGLLQNVGTMIIFAPRVMSALKASGPKVSDMLVLRLVFFLTVGRVTGEVPAYQKSNFA